MSLFLPPEIITNILSRLSVKLLLRFRCVSKPWCSLIDGPDFVQMHLNQSLYTKSNRHLILGFMDISLHSVEFHSLCSPAVDSIDSSHRLQPPIPVCDVSNFCNGLCNVFIKKSNYTYNYIWNPFTRKYIELPAISLDREELGYSPDIELKLTDKHGFAYVSETDEYKVVQVIEIRGYDYSYLGNQAHMFSSRSNEWERFETYPYLVLPTRALDVHLNGGLHGVVEIEFLQWELMVFDTRTKQHSLLPKPDFVRVIVDVMVEVDVFEGNLCLLLTRFINPAVVMDIWIMKDYGVKASWFNLLSVYVEPGSVIGTHALTMTYSEVLTHNNKKLLWYNLRCGTMREVSVNVLPPNFFAEVLTESLVSLPGFISLDNKKAKCQHEKPAERA